MTFQAIMLSGEGCAPCARMLPVFQQVCQETDIEPKVIKVTGGSEEATKYGVRTVPTFVFEKDGVVVGKLVGVQPKSAISSRINSLR